MAENKGTYRGFTDAQARASKKYMEKFSVARVRMEKERYEALQAAAAASGDSVNVYINKAIDLYAESKDSVKPAKSRREAPNNPNEFLFHPATTKAILDGAKATGEDAEAFVYRAVTMQAKRDTTSAKMGLDPKTGEKMEREKEGK